MFSRFELLAFVGILFHVFSRSEHKPVPIGSFVQLFDQNHDGKVEIGTEINEYYNNLVKLQNALGSGQNGTEISENGTNTTALNSTESAAENHLRGIPLSEYRDLFTAAQNTLIDPKMLNAADVDGDGKLDIGEQTNFTKSIAAQYFDTNGDGFVDDAESKAYDANVAALQFKEFDANKDEKLDRAELKALITALSGPLGGIIESVLPPKKPLPLEHANELLGREYGLKPAQIKAADVDQDGNLTFKEFLDNIGIPLKEAKQNLVGLQKLITGEMVEKADKNGNGFLDYGELINLVTLDAAIKLGDTDGDGQLNQREFVEGFEALQAYYLGLNGGDEKTTK